jgi:hypothetical protein
LTKQSMWLRVSETRLIGCCLYSMLVTLIRSHYCSLY